MFCCVKSSLSGLLSPTVAFMIIQTPLFKAMKVECRCRGRTALVCMAVCTGVCVCGGGERLPVLCSHPVLGTPQGFSQGTLASKQTLAAIGLCPLQQRSQVSSCCACHLCV